MRVPVDLVPWRVTQGTFSRVAFQLFEANIKIEAKLAKVEHLDIVVAGGKGGIVPRVALVLSDLNSRNGFEFGGLLVHSQT